MTRDTHTSPPPNIDSSSLQLDGQLRPLTSLKWPVVPEPSALEDPLTRNDPKPLQLPQYEAIATSHTIRQALQSNPDLPNLLQSLDRLPSHDREDALQRLLGVANSRSQYHSASDIVSGASTEEVEAFRKLAEAIEVAVRPPAPEGNVPGLDWTR